MGKWWRIRRTSAAAQPQLYAELLRAVSRLALAPEAQIAYLRYVGTAPSTDELALEFDAGFGYVSQLREEGWLTDLEVSQLEGIDAKLAAMSGGERPWLWEIEALATSAEWQDVRQRAQEFLFLSWGKPRGPVD